MGLLLSILVGCVGVLELLSSLKQVTNEMSTTSTGPTTPCLSYHGQMTDHPSFHDSLCSISHSGDIPVPGSAKQKLENLHEYSLRVRSELKSFGSSDWGTLSECSTRDLFSPSRTSSRLSLNVDELSAETGDHEGNSMIGLSGETESGVFTGVKQSIPNFMGKIDIETIVERNIERSMTKNLNTEKGPSDYVRVPTPIPVEISQEISHSDSSLDVNSSFENESGNDVPTRIAFHQVPVVVSRFTETSSSPESSIDEDDDISGRVRKRGFIRISRSRSPDVKNNHGDNQDHVIVRSVPKLLSNEGRTDVKHSGIECESISQGSRSSALVEDVENSIHNYDSIPKKSRSDKTRTSTVLRKPTRLKSENAETSKSAENLMTGPRRTKRQRDPESRKSDISVQTMKREDWLRDEWTNTSPTDSKVSISGVSGISGSHTSVSVHVQTSFDDQESLIDKTINSESMGNFDVPVMGLSESKRDVGIKDRDNFGKKAFKNRRFPTGITMKSRSLDGYPSEHWVQDASHPMIDGNHNESTRNNGIRAGAKTSQFEDNNGEANGWRPSKKLPRGIMESSRSMEEDSVDDEYADAEEASTSESGGGSIEYCVPITEESDKPSWVIL